MVKKQNYMLINLVCLGHWKLVNVHLVSFVTFVNKLEKVIIHFVKLSLRDDLFTVTNSIMSLAPYLLLVM